MNSMNFDELRSLSPGKHKASLSSPSSLIDKLVDEHPENAPDVRQVSSSCMPRWSAATGSERQLAEAPLSLTLGRRHRSRSATPGQDEVK
jgi:hypothetical protein